MRYTKTACGLAAALLLTFAASSANALATRTWVAKTTLAPDDMNPCSRTAPCYTFAAAIAKTEPGGEITVLDPGAYGPVTITKSITINGTPGGGHGSIIANPGSNGVVINLPANDPFRTVRLNRLDINGASAGLHGIRIVNNQTAGVSVVIENTNIDGFTGSGILDERSLGGKLVVSDTVVRHTLQSGILIAGGGQGSKIQATLSNVRVHNSLHAALLVAGAARVMASNSVFSGSSFGVDVAQAGNEALIDGSTISGNAQFGVYTENGGVLRLSNSEVSFNGTGVFGPVESFSNNRFIANGPGAAITPIGPPTSPSGQQ